MNNAACFNDLSVNPLCGAAEEVSSRVRSFVELVRNVRAHTGITKIRCAEGLDHIQLADGFTMQDFCNESFKTNRSQYAIALLSMFVKPQVDMDDDDSLASYFDTDVKLKISSEQKVDADGFRAAYCQRTFCVGFDSDELWKKDFFPLSVTSGNRERTVDWACISSLDFYRGDQEHERRKQAFDSWLQGVRPISLVCSAKNPEEKPINLRDDHGKDKLMAHAKLLRNSPYVESILTSLPFESHSRQYISKIYDDGLVDIVLYWEDKGYGMRVKTTGRNIAETGKIAEILRDKYGRT